jgi:hypothetical protein
MDPEDGSQSGRVRRIESLRVHLLLKPSFAIGSLENSPTIVNLPSRVGTPRSAQVAVGSIRSITGYAHTVGQLRAAISELARMLGQETLLVTVFNPKVVG